jgi:hypothetical protein
MADRLRVHLRVILENLNRVLHATRHHIGAELFAQRIVIRVDCIRRGPFGKQLGASHWAWLDDRYSDAVLEEDGVPG